MENSGCYWDKREDAQLKNLYVKYKMDISEISLIHQRTPNAIQKRLETLNLIKNDDNDYNIRLTLNNLEKKFEEYILTQNEKFKKQVKIINELIEKIKFLELSSLD